jgi:hypothetical protein
MSYPKEIRTLRETEEILQKYDPYKREEFSKVIEYQLNDRKYVIFFQIGFRCCLVFDENDNLIDKYERTLYDEYETYKGKTFKEWDKETE